MNKTIVEMITNRLMEQMNKGIIPWRRPWSGVVSEAISYTTGKAYSLLNQLLIGEPGEYLTFKQIQTLGGHLKAGSKSKQITFWSQIKIEDENTEKEKTIPYLRYYNVFNVNDVEGIKPKNEIKDNGLIKKLEAEEIIDNYQLKQHININRDALSNKAFYNQITDTIMVPSIKQYNCIEEYYSTLFHEMIHSTGHESRLNRFNSSKSVNFGSEEYSLEELVAEIGSAVLVNKCGLETEKSFNNSAAYLQSWMKALSKKPEMFIYAASRAEKAVNLIIE